MARATGSIVRLLAGVREPVRVATTSSIALSGLQTIDGVALAAGDRVLVKNQSAAAGNGIYDASEGTWYRSGDARTSRTINKGVTVSVQSGTVNGGTVYAFQTLNPELETDSISITLYQSFAYAADIQALVAAALFTTQSYLNTITAAAASILGSVTNPVFASKVAAEAYNPAIAPVYIRLEGYYNASAGGARYKKVVSEPAHAGKFQTLEGSWYEIAEAELNVLQFGATGDGGTDDAAAFNAAAVCAAALGNKTVHVPATALAYIVGSTISVPAGVSFESEGAAVYISHASAHMFHLLGGSSAIRGLRIAATVTRSGSGAYVYIPAAAGSCTVERCIMQDGVYGIRIDGANSTKVLLCNILNCTSDGIFIEGTNLATEIASCTIGGDAASRSAIAMLHAGDITMSHLQLLGCQYGFLAVMNPTFAASSIKASQVFFDSNSVYGMWINASGGMFLRSTFTACEFTSAGTAGIRLETSASGLIDGLTFTNCTINLNGTGVQLLDAGVKNITFDGGMCTANTGVGISVSPNVTHFTICNMIIGPSGALIGNDRPIAVSAGCDHFIITGNQMKATGVLTTGNNEAYQNLSAGTNKIDGATYNLQ